MRKNATFNNNNNNLGIKWSVKNIVLNELQAGAGKNIAVQPLSLNVMPTCMFRTCSSE